MNQLRTFRILLASAMQAGSIFFACSAQAQSTSEIGVGLAGVAYKGDITPEYQPEANRPGIFAFYRRDISAPITLRAGLLYGMLRASDVPQSGGNNANTLPLGSYRQASMKGSVLELSGIVEYNFLNFHDRRDKVHFTPFVFVGVAPFRASTETTSALPELEGSGSMLGIAIPAGVGLKLALSRHWNLGLEAGAHKAFTDQLDHISTQNATVANSHEQDWYYHAGLSISYTLYKIRCPDSYKNDPTLLR